MHDLLPTQDIGATDEYNGTEDDPVYLLTLAAWQKTHLFLGGYINLIVLADSRLTGYALFQLVAVTGFQEWFFQRLRRRYPHEVPNLQPFLQHSLAFR